MSSIATDYRQALTQLTRHPRFAAMIIAMIAIAIAGNAAVFRIVNGLFLQPLPFGSPEQLVNLDQTAPAWGLEYTGVSFTDFTHWRDANESFDSMAVYTVRGANAAEAEEASRVNVVVSSHELPGVLGIEPVLGRFFSADEDVPNGPAVALVSQSYWETRLGADPSVLGTTLRINGTSVELIGVYPDSVKAVANGEIWRPLGEDADNGTGWYLTGIGRLAAGVTQSQAAADLTRTHKAQAEVRRVNEITAPVLQSMSERYLGPFRLGASALQAATVLLLLIACANIAALMLARSLDRVGEYGIRLAIGSNRARLTRQLLSESLLLGIIGGAIGTVLGYSISELIVAEIAPRFPAFVTFDLDAGFMVFIVLATLGSTVVFSLMPALSAGATSPAAVLSKSGVRASDGRNRLRSMNILVAAEVALTLMLLASAGLFVRDAARLLDADWGIDTENMLVYSFAMPPSLFPTPEERTAFIEEHLERAGSIPGVTSIAAASSLPLRGHWGWTFRAEGVEPPAAGDVDPVVLMRVVSDDYFSTMGIGIAQGRPFERSEGQRSPNSVVVNEAFVKTFFPGVDDPTGRRIRPLFDNAFPWMTIVGVARDVRHYGVEQEMRPGVYTPMSGYSRFGVQIAARTAVPPMTVVPAIREQMRNASSEIAIYDIEVMQDQLDSSLWAKNAYSWLIATFSSIALVLSLVGIYGVIAHSIRRRTNEYCIRMALGASNSEIVARVMKHGLLIAGAGVAAGLIIMAGIARLVSRLIVTVSAADPLVYLGATALLFIAVAAACAAPALRLRHLQPGGALRAD
ncbi:MAG TPA: ABC transporter permease [Gammaproteobacteria bacterium]|nr:ABC transporter permease [Gammaproteobacteria bacterium]